MTTSGPHPAPEVPGFCGEPGTDAPVFTAPWQAQAFALTLALHERGMFTWPQWAQALHAAIARAQARGDADTGHTYYHHWLDALHSLLIEQGIADAQLLAWLEQAWHEAAERTPHGQPIELDAHQLKHIRAG